MANLNFPSPNGWNNWVYIKTSILGHQKLDAPFPSLYTPSRSFWLRSLIDNCLIPWLVPIDTLTAFFIGGGISGTLLGSLGGVEVATRLLSVKGQQTFGIGRGALAPRMGYTIDDRFKQHIYTRMDIINSPSTATVIATNVGVELLQNYKLKRIYVNHGEVVRYTKDGNKHILTLDIESGQVPPDITASGDTITITQKNGNIFNVTVQEIKNNWDVFISDPGDNLPGAGDFYQFNSTWCLQDPFLLSGFWYGTDSDSWASSMGRPASGNNLYVTSHISPYEEGKFLGLFIWKENDEVQLPPQPAYGFPMGNSINFGWAFLGFNNASFSKVYSDDMRYIEVPLDQPNDEGATVEYRERGTASSSDYSQFISNEELSYIRVQISTGGYSDRHNWFSPILKGEYIKVADKFYKIMDQVEADIIDVSLISVDGTSRFDPGAHQDYSIMNHKGWFISEHYDENSASASTTGVFRGEVTNITYSPNDNISYITCNVYGDSFVLWTKNTAYEPPDIDNNFKDRYRKTHDHLTNEPIKKYNKFQDWKMVSNSGSTEDNIISIVFPVDLPKTFSEPYDITLTVEGDKSNISNSDIYISFDNAYGVYGSLSKESGFSYSASITGGIRDASGFIASDVLCLNGEYFSNPYIVDIPIGSRIGCCEGVYFGTDINGSAQSNIGLFMLVTTLRSARGIASLFHALREEDWVVYQDPVSRKITIRRGSMDFTEYPMKNMIAIGGPEDTEIVTESTTNIINLNTNKERLRRLQFKVPVGTRLNPALMFAIGDSDNFYGFYISGDGSVNLHMFTYRGIMPGTVLSSNFMSDERYVSPVYVYKKNQYQNLDTMEVDIGIKPDEGPIYVKYGEVSNIHAQYINENQTLENIGYFDIVRLKDGENLLFYGGNTGEFVVNNNLNNSTDNGTQWSYRNSVMCIGTYNDSFMWGSPIRKRFDDVENRNQYPLMIFNAAEYLSSIYNPMNDTISIFCRCISNKNDYVGCFIVAVNSLDYKTFFCNDPDMVIANRDLSFQWRPPRLEDAFINNESRSWIDPENIINDSFSFDPSQDAAKKDEFYRILGPLATHSRVQYADEIGIPSSSILRDGTYVFLYDTNAGVRAIFSANGGRTWAKSNLVYARDARAAILIGDYLFYIVSSGIEMKRTHMTDFYTGASISFKNLAGQNIEDLEESTQNILDETSHYLIGSGAIDLQRLSGYITPEGIIKIFFYDTNNSLKCMESKDSFKWKVADNF